MYTGNLFSYLRSMGVRAPTFSKSSDDTSGGLLVVKAFSGGFAGSFFPSIEEYAVSAEPDKVLWALRAIMEAAGSKFGVILVSDERQDVSATLKEKLKGTFKDKNSITVLSVDTGAGLGNAVAEWVLKVRAYAGNTASAADNPLLVYSSMELLRAYDALTGEKPVTRTLVYCGGEVASPGFYDVPLGTRYSDVVEACSSLLSAGDYAVLTSNGYHDNLKDTIETDISVPVTKDTEMLIVLPLDHTLIKKAETSLTTMLKRVSSVCGQCRLCTDMCPAYLNGGGIYPHLIVRDIAEGKAETSPWIAGADLCISCGVCIAVCPAGISPMQINEFIKGIIHESVADGRPTNSKPVVEMAVTTRAGGAAVTANTGPFRYAFSRKLPAKKLAERFGLFGYAARYVSDKTALAGAKELPYVYGAMHTVNGISMAEIRLSQAGGNARAVVKTGDMVAAGDLIAEGGGNGESSLHTGIAGTVSVVDKERIIIVATGE